MSVEDTFNLLADAANVRHPNPERENRGLCPAHLDTHNPGLVFRVADSGKLVTHCFAQECEVGDIADALGVPVQAFFPEGWSGRVAPPAEYHEPSLLDLLLLLPLGMSHEDRESAVFRVLDAAYHIGMLDDETIDVEQPMRTMTNNEVGNYIYLFVCDTLSGGNWHDEHDRVLTLLRQLNRSHRTHVLSTPSAIPRRNK